METNIEASIKRCSQKQQAPQGQTQKKRLDHNGHGTVSCSAGTHPRYCARGAGGSVLDEIQRHLCPVGSPCNRNFTENTATKRRLSATENQEWAIRAQT